MRHYLIWNREYQDRFWVIRAETEKAAWEKAAALCRATPNNEDGLGNYPPGPGNMYDIIPVDIHQA